MTIHRVHANDVYIDSGFSCKTNIWQFGPTLVGSGVETRLGHLSYLGQPGHVLSGSNGSDLVYKTSGSDPDLDK